MVINDIKIIIQFILHCRVMYHKVWPPPPPPPPPYKKWLLFKNPYFYNHEHFRASFCRGTILFPEMLNKFEETLAVTEMHTFKHEPFLLGVGRGRQASMPPFNCAGQSTLQTAQLTTVVQGCALNEIHLKEPFTYCQFFTRR